MTEEIRNPKSGFPDGRFLAGGKAFEIVPPTPVPWSNVLSNGEYGAVWTERGGAFAWCGNSVLDRLTRWDQDLVRNPARRNIYLLEGDAIVRTLTPAPLGGEARWRVVFGAGYATYHGECPRFRTRLDAIVLPGKNVEMWYVEVERLGAKQGDLRLVSAQDILLGTWPDVHREFHRLFLRCRATEKNGRTHLLFHKELDTRPGQKEHWNEPFPGVFCHAALAPVAGFETDRAAFYGYGGSDEAPEMLKKPPRRCEPGAWGDAMASLDLVFPDADRQDACPTRIETAFVSAYAGSDDEAIALIDAAAGIGRDAALASAAAFWEREIGPLACETPSPDLDAMASHWLRLQTIVGRLYGRCALYQASGAFGFRDQLQDSLVLLPHAPKRAGAQLTLHLEHQFKNGEVLHWWHPGPETGPRTKCSDDFLWPILAAAERHRETGETKFLKERVPFIDGRAKSVWNHLRKSIELAWKRRSARGLPLLGECDWNDGLSSAGDEGRGESVWVGQFLHLLLLEMDHLAKAAGKKDEGYLERAAELRRIINQHAWDGAWYIQGTNDAGAPIGSARCAEGRIHLNPQTWSVIGQVAAEEPVLDGPIRWTERARTAMAAAKERLVVDWGVLLLAPAYQTPDASIGYITRYAPGRRENGGVYTHAAVWTAKAARMLGDAELVQKVVFSLLPPVRGRDPRYLAEPYVTPGNIDGPLTPTPGRGGWTWYTGSSAWLNRTIFEDLLGIRPRPDALVFAPMVPADWNRFKVTRPWRGKLLSIEMVRGETPGIRIKGAGKGRSREIAGNILAWKDLSARAVKIELEVVFT